MIRNYLTIAFRNLLKSKLFSLINISGMAISITCLFLIVLYISDELKYDKHVKDASLKFRVYAEYFGDDGSVRKGAMVPPMIGPAAADEYPEIEFFTRIQSIYDNVLFAVGDKKMTEKRGGYADPTVFEMFSLKLVSGDPQTALHKPYTIAISRTLATRYFGQAPALEQSVEVFDTTYTVAAVYEDFPLHSHLQIDYFISMETLVRQIPQLLKSWQWSQFHTYIKFKSETDPSEFEGRLKDLAERQAWPVTKPNGIYYIPHLTALQKIHLHASDQLWDVAVRGNAQTIYILSATAFFILIIAILNFVNLSTARAISRFKEVGIRKVVGAVRTQLIYQFVSESIVLALIALLIGGLITELTLPFLNRFGEKAIPAGVFVDPLTIVTVLVFAVMLGVAAGAYPAFYLSGRKPAHILYNRPLPGSGKILFRKGLVILQFVLSFLLITASFVVSDQHRFLRTTDMGFERDNVVVLPLRGDMRRNIEAIKNSFSDHPGIVSATAGYGLPGEAFASDGIKDKNAGRRWPASMLLADHDYVKTLRLILVAGRDFSTSIPTDTADAFIISESTAKMLGHRDPEEALGHEISWDTWFGGVKEGKVIGVVKDFHLNGLRDQVVPIVIHMYPYFQTISLRIKNENIPATITHLENKWKMFNADWPFEYHFLDQNFDQLYKSEEKLAALFSIFTGFTIFVACLGLFGLVVYDTSQKYKEISIRKVFGAGETATVMRLIKTYLLLIAISFIVAVPFSYFLSEKWLQKFAYRIEITPLLFIKAALLILAISLVTVGIQSFKAARTNPVNALKEQ
jgi:putative ABC transport system permease protein